MSVLTVRRLSTVVAVLLVAAGGVAAGTGASGYTLRLDFTNADGVVVNEDVTVAGVKAGKVEGLRVVDNIAQITVSVDSKFAPLPTDTRALVRSLGLLGNKYVELIPGKAGGADLPSGSELTVESTTSPTDLDQINAIFDEPTRKKVKAMTLEGAIALGGRAQTLNTALLQLRNLAVAAEPVTGILEDHQVALDRATIAFDTLTQKLVREDAALRGLVSHGGSVLSVLAARDNQLAGLLQHGDFTFTRLDAALSGNEDNLAGFFARQPAGLSSTDYQLNASIPATRAAQPLINPLFDLLANMADSFNDADGPGDPTQPNSGTQWALRTLAVPCASAAGTSC